MSIKYRLFSIAALALSLAAFSAFSFAQDTKPATDTTTEKADKPESRGFGRKFGKEGFDGRERGFGRHGGMMRMFHDLNLTDAQKEQIKTIMEANKPDQATMEEFRTLGKAKHEGTITPEQQARLTTLREQAQAKGKAVHEQIEAILTPEQKAQLEQKKAEMKQRFEERRQKRQQQQDQKPPAADTPKVN